MLGPREPPAKKVRIRKKNVKQESYYNTSYFDSDSDNEVTRKPKRNIDDTDDVDDIDDTEEEPETLSAVIALEV